MISFGEFPDELLLSILSSLIKTDNFPNSLVHFTKSNKQMNKIAQDASLWHQALSFYFPFVKLKPFDNCRQHFIACHEQACAILKRYQLTFKDYADFLVSHVAPSADTAPILMGLCIGAGQQIAFSPTQLLLSKNYSLLFSAALNNVEGFINILNDPAPPSNEFKRASLLIASEHGHQRICSYLLSHFHIALDRATLCEGFLKACEQGNIELVQIFFNPITAPSLKFSLAKGLNIVCAKGYADCAALLLTSTYLKNNLLALNEAVRLSLTHQQVDCMRELLKEGKIHRNIVLLIEILKIAINQKNKEMVSLILENQDINFSLTIILDSCEQATNNDDLDTASIILKSRLFKIPSYARKNLFYSACDKGLLRIISCLVENDSNLLNKYTLTQAIQAAQSKSHEAVVKYLQACSKPLALASPSFLHEDDIEKDLAKLSLSEHLSQSPGNLYLAQFNAKRSTNRDFKSTDEGANLFDNNKQRVNLSNSNH